MLRRVGEGRQGCTAPTGSGGLTGSGAVRSAFLLRAVCASARGGAGLGGPADAPRYRCVGVRPSPAVARPPRPDLLPTRTCPRGPTEPNRAPNYPRLAGPDPEGAGHKSERLASSAGVEEAARLGWPGCGGCRGRRMSGADCLPALALARLAPGHAQAGVPGGRFPTRRTSDGPRPDPVGAGKGCRPVQFPYYRISSTAPPCGRQLLGRQAGPRPGPPPAGVLAGILAGVPSPAHTVTVALRASQSILPDRLTAGPG